MPLNLKRLGLKYHSMSLVSNIYMIQAILHKLCLVPNRNVYRGPVLNWVNTELLVSFRKNYTVIGTCVVLSPYTSLLMSN